MAKQSLLPQVAPAKGPYPGLRNRIAPGAASCCVARWLRVLTRNCRIQAAVFSIAIGIAHPFCTELSKTAQTFACSGATCAPTGKRAMPFHVITLTLTSQTLAVALAALTASFPWRRGSLQAAAEDLLNPRAFFSCLLIGILYGVGDFLQTTACNLSSAPVVLIVGQSKLLITAILSKLLLLNVPSMCATRNFPSGLMGSARGRHQWLRLLTISLAAIAAVAPTEGYSMEMSDSLRGALLVLLKAVLSASGALISERLYKTERSNFWVVSFHVQSAMLLTSLFLLFADFHRGHVDLSFSELFLRGPAPLCPCVPQLGETTCLCADRDGWDLRTWLAVVAIVLNGYATGFFLKHLSAVCKAVCNLASSGLGCLACWACCPSGFSIFQVLVSCIVLVQSYDYAAEKAEECHAASPRPLKSASDTPSVTSRSTTPPTSGPRTPRREPECLTRAGEVDQVEWVAHYAAGPDISLKAQPFISARPGTSPRDC